VHANTMPRLLKELDGDLGDAAADGE